LKQKPVSYQIISLEDTAEMGKLKEREKPREKGGPQLRRKKKNHERKKKNRYILSKKGRKGGFLGGLAGREKRRGKGKGEKKWGRENGEKREVGTSGH